VETKEKVAPDVSELLSVTDAARLLAIQRPNIYKLFRRGAIRYVEIGGHRFVPLSEIRNYRKSRTRVRESA
jgi:excisionase family DNA binding protein